MYCKFQESRKVNGKRVYTCHNEEAESDICAYVPDETLCDLSEKNVFRFDDDTIGDIKYHQMKDDEICEKLDRGE